MSNIASLVEMLPRFWRAPATPDQARRSVLLIVLFATVIRIGLAASTGLGVDESYWASVSRVPSLSYVDDAPMQGWLVAAARGLLGSEASLALRLPFIALFALSSLLMFRLTARLFGERAGLWAVVALNLAPVFTLAHGTWILPDGALIFFELAAACVLASIFFERSSIEDRKMRRWLGAGTLGGCALLAKYHGVFIFLGVFVFLLSASEQRRWLRTPGPWLGAAVALAVFSPVIVWNSMHDWAGLSFQLDRLGSNPTFSLALALDGDSHPPSAPWTGALRMFGGAMLFLGWLIVPLTLVLVRAMFRGPGRPAEWFLVCLATGPIVVFSSVGLWANQQFPHWPMPGWLFAFPLFGAAWAGLEARRPIVVRYSMLAWTIALLAVVGTLVAHIRVNTPSFEAFRLPLRSDPTIGLLDWKELRKTIAERRLINSETPAVAAAHWMDAAKVAYALGGAVPVVCVCQIPQHFPYVHHPAQFAGRNMIIVEDKLTNRKQRWLARHFARLEPLDSVNLHRAGAIVKTLKLYHGIDFRAEGLGSPAPLEESGATHPPSAVGDCRSDKQRREREECWVD
ncbi:MAG: glycosyltransferase family 39 protein [Hyphomicrobiaceae bacterium]